MGIRGYISLSSESVSSRMAFLAQPLVRKMSSEKSLTVATRLLMSVLPRTRRSAHWLNDILMFSNSSSVNSTRASSGKKSLCALPQSFSTAVRSKARKRLCHSDSLPPHCLATALVASAWHSVATLSEHVGSHAPRCGLGVSDAVLLVGKAELVDKAGEE